jgi:two-component system NarL family response regulator
LLLVAAEVQVLSSHPLLGPAVERVIAHIKDFSVRALPCAANEAEALNCNASPRVFLLDACSLRTDLGRLAQRFRTHAPGSKFLALLAPDKESHHEMLRLFYWGLDGFVELHKTWQLELPHALRSILKGQIWAPPAVLAAYVGRMRALLDAQMLPGHSLTKREGQILQMLMRSLSNKEIAGALGISERTAKYHVSNILSKLQLADRRSLLPTGFSSAAGMAT